MMFQNAFFAECVFAAVSAGLWKLTGRIVHGLSIRRPVCSAASVWNIVPNSVFL